MKVLANGLYAAFGEMCWPNPGEAMRMLCIGEAEAPGDYLLSVLRAYMELVKMPCRQREEIVRRLLEAVELEAKGDA